jgi:hypothetical protein
MWAIAGAIHSATPFVQRFHPSKPIAVEQAQTPKERENGDERQ